MKNKIFVGIDTSNYTTSAAAIDECGRLVSLGRLLPVKEGERGLRQQDALFHHTVNLPEIISELGERLRAEFDGRIAAIGVSEKPRRAEGSYMPCFLAGVSAAKTASELLGVPLFRFSHQEGHIEAAILGCDEAHPFPEKNDGFFAFHLSGGTCELVRVSENSLRYDSEIVSESLDITLGQLIDRCGVKVGLSFPCGKELEKLALASDAKYKIRVSRSGGGVNISGFENKFDELIKSKGREDSARYVFSVAEEVIKTMLEISGAESSGKPILFAGGVMSSVILKRALGTGDGRYFFTEPRFATDNSAGIARLTMRNCLNG